MQESNKGEAGNQGHSLNQNRIFNPEQIKQGHEKAGYRRFAYPAKAQAGQGNSKLANRKIGIKMDNSKQSCPGAPVVGLGLHFNTHTHNFYECEFGGNKHCIQANQGKSETKHQPVIHQ